ncbi:unnamed protein product [Nezara viridula]|uniref:Battenin n=1 Tax=Nezara viridula TaxID=85310 RepID=A0A9P0MJ80_NEZVI|nr:unnamed protein product [Nezara viridula]
MVDEEPKKFGCGALWEARTIISFWWLGLCNNYGYVVMLSAAHDILSDFDVEDHVESPFIRDCNTLSTGVILLADIVPTMMVKVIAPFLPLMIFVRMAGVVLLSAIGFVLVASRIDKLVVLLGVVCTSFSCGLGETTLLSYMVFFKTQNVISTWSSGTGGAGILGAGSYAGLIAAGLSPSAAIWIMLIVPTVQAVCFVFFIDHPKTDVKIEESEIPTEADLLTCEQKMSLLPVLLIRYMAPFGLVYLFEYFINQGLFELLYFPNSFLTHHQQYRMYQLLYQIGVFISRSSMNIVKIDWLWVMAILQFCNVVLFTCEVMQGFITFLAIMMVLVVWEGLLGGGCYVNTYRRIASEMERDQRQFSMGICGVADALMITLAGILANPAHNSLCNAAKTYPYINPRKSKYFLRFFLKNKYD